jgi:chromosomal replication initiator protein
VGGIFFAPDFFTALLRNYRCTVPRAITLPDTFSTSAKPPRGGKFRLGLRRNYRIKRLFRRRDFARKKIFRHSARPPFDSIASVCRIRTSSREFSFAQDAAEVTKDDKEIVSALRASLAGKVGQERYELWFGAGTRLHFDGRTLRVAAPTQFFLDWIRANFRRQIEEACRETCGVPTSLEFVLDCAADADSPESQPRSIDMSVAAAGLSRGDETTDGQIADGAHRSSAVKSNGRAHHLPEMPAKSNGQEVPSIPTRRFARLNTFVVGESNRLAAASAEMVVRRPGQVNPLVLHGPTGVGKTHLLEGIWSALRRAAPGRMVLYLTAEQFTSHFLEALRGSGLPNFRRKYRAVGALIVEDLQFFVGKRATQIELLHTIDDLSREGRQLVFSADRPPAELAELGPELTGRLAGGLVCRIDPPDYAVRLGIVAEMARRLGLDVPDEVRRLIASRLTNNAREISGAMCRLQATAEAVGRPITLAMAEESLADLFRAGGRAVRLTDIERAVCDVFGLEPSSLHSEAKGNRVCHPRMLAMWLARKHTRAALSEIGRYFGRRSHSTVVSAQKRVDDWMSGGQTIKLADHCWNADDAIRQIERRLSVG